MSSTVMSLMLLGAILGFDSAKQPVSEAPPGVADERDGQILQTALLHLLKGHDFKMTREREDDAVIVLNVRTPEKTGMLRPEQVRHDIGEGHTISEDLQRDLLRRNERPGTYEARVATFGKLKLDRRIVVADIAARMDQVKGSRYYAFEHAFPTARGYAKAYLPGYSKDASIAVVRASVGPSPHGAMATIVLERSGDTWLVKWLYIAWFC